MCRAVLFYLVLCIASPPPLAGRGGPSPIAMRAHLQE